MPGSRGSSWSRSVTIPSEARVVRGINEADPGWTGACKKNRYVPLYPLSSNVGDEVVILVILVLPAVALADLLDAGDEFDRPDPLDHLVAELVLDPEP